jgi:hypothetical protein
MTKTKATHSNANINSHPTANFDHGGSEPASKDRRKAAAAKRREAVAAKRRELVKKWHAKPFFHRYDGSGKIDRVGKFEGHISDFKSVLLMLFLWRAEDLCRPTFRPEGTDYSRVSFPAFARYTFFATKQEMLDALFASLPAEQAAKAKDIMDTFASLPAEMRAAERRCFDAALAKMRTT